MNTHITVPAETFRQAVDAMTFAARWADGHYLTNNLATALAALKACETLPGDRATFFAYPEQHASSVPGSGAASGNQPCPWCIPGIDNCTHSAADIAAGIEYGPPAAPWQLPAPPAGRRWHRDDWTQDMLPDGWRPFLIDEAISKGDEILTHNGFREFVDRCAGQLPACPSSEFCRTRRPLPTAETVMPPIDVLYKGEHGTVIGKYQEPAPVADEKTVTVTAAPDPYAEQKKWFAEDGVVQFKCAENKYQWMDVFHPHWDGSPECYRRKPKPVMVELGPEDVPIMSALRLEEWSPLAEVTCSPALAGLIDALDKEARMADSVADHSRKWGMCDRVARGAASAFRQAAEMVRQCQASEKLSHEEGEKTP